VLMMIGIGQVPLAAVGMPLTGTPRRGPSGLAVGRAAHFL